MHGAIALSSGGRRTVRFIVLLACSLLVFFVLSHMRPLVPRACDLPSRIAVAVGFFAFALLAGCSTRLREYRSVLLAFCIASVALLVDYELGFNAQVAALLGVDARSPAAYALDKLESSLMIVAVVLALNAAAGGTLADLRLAGGRWKRSLAVGGGLFTVFAVGGIAVSPLLFGVRELDAAQILRWLPWVLVFIFANALSEELAFRGLLLRRLEPLLGAFPSNLLVTIAFVLHHAGVSYAPDQLLFLGVLLPLSLAWGWLTQRTDSLWGAVLFHAATDIPVALAVFSGG